MGEVLWLRLKTPSRSCKPRQRAWEKGAGDKGIARKNTRVRHRRFNPGASLHSLADLSADASHAFVIVYENAHACM